MVNYREQAASEVQDVKESRNQNNSPGRGYNDLEQIEVDFDETAFVKFYPTTAVTGVPPEGEGNPVIRFRDEDNNGHDEQGYLGIVLDELSIDTEDASDEGGFDMSGATIVETDDDDYTEYRAVNFNDSKTTEKFDGDAVSIDGDQYGVEETHEELDERVILVVDRTSAVSVAKKIDVCGGEPAGMDPESEDSINSGLIEYPPSDVDADIGWRYARDEPELREELLGNEVTFLVSRREEIDDEHTGYLGQDDSNTEPVLGTGDDGDTHRDESRASYAELVAAGEAREMMWYSVFADGESLEPVTRQSTDRPYLEWSFDPTANHLPDEQWEFVQEYQANELPQDEGTIVENIRENFDEADEERIVGLIQNGAGE
jgi:hypothetical protein